MKSRLTLILDSDTIRRAKDYVHRHKGSSLSKLVESYFNALTISKQELREQARHPIVSSLAGAARISRVLDVKEDYTAYLIQKYR